MAVGWVIIVLLGVLCFRPDDLLLRYFGELYDFLCWGFTALRNDIQCMIFSYIVAVKVVSIFLSNNEILVR
jgi:hypothetical protein